AGLRALAGRARLHRPGLRLLSGEHLRRGGRSLRRSAVRSGAPAPPRADALPRGAVGRCRDRELRHLHRGRAPEGQRRRRRGAGVQRAALSATLALALLAAAATARAHLLPGGATSLVGMMAAADGMLVARAAAATHERDAQHAATPFLARETIAGDVPADG